MPSKKKPSDAITILMDPNVPWPHRRHLLMSLCTDEESQASLQALLQAAAAAKADELVQERLEKLDVMIAALDEGALSYATFVEVLPPRNGVRRAHVKLPDGASAFMPAADESLLQSLRRGQNVLVDARLRAVLDVAADISGTGEVARFKRRISPDVVEITFAHEEESHVFHAAAPLIEKLDRGEVEQGASLRVSRQQNFAFDALPPAESRTGYRFICREPVPDVVLERDLGAPPAFIRETIEHVRLCMTQPDTFARFHLRRCITKLLEGVSGSGKTYSILAIWNAMYRLMSELTGIPVGQLPPRVLKLSLPKVLSHWLGQSDKMLDRFFDEVEQLASERFTAPDGQVYDLPVLMIFEEAEGLGRERGTDHDSVFDRIQTTFLTRMDSQKLRDQAVVALFSTNTPHLLDPAVARRIGGTVERFGRLRRAAFREVLRRHLRGMPIESNNGHGQGELESMLTEQMTSWLYSRNGDDRGVVELSYVGQSNPVIRRLSEFMTPSLVDRAVQQAASKAARQEFDGGNQTGLSAALLASCLENQVRTSVGRIRAENVHNYLDIPEGIRIAGVRRLEGSASMPLQLMRSE